MRQWYEQWYGSAVPPSSMSHAMPGMAGHDPRAIDGARPFDKAFQSSRRCSRRFAPARPRRSNRCARGTTPGTAPPYPRPARCPVTIWETCSRGTAS
jgi:hypothetical protein